MENKQYLTKLTGGELSHLWIAYQYQTLSQCGITYFLNHIEDKQIEHLLQEGLMISKKRIEQIIDIFKNEGYPIPQGFTDGDVNLNAPRIFSDKLYLEYVIQTLMMESVSFGQSFMCAIDEKVMDFFNEVMIDSQTQEIKAKNLAKDKGIFIRGPKIPIPKHINFVKKDSFLAGWFGDKRPLLGIEISNLVLHAKRNALGQAVITAFSQVAESKEVRAYFERGREISGKHVKVFTDLLHDDYLPSSSILMTSEVTDATEAPFSDKLMMSFITNLIGISIGGYAMSIAMSPRRDLGVTYTRLIAEIAQFSDDGAEILIKNAWMEQPPIAADRKKLAK